MWLAVLDLTWHSSLVMDAPRRVLETVNEIMYSTTTDQIAISTTRRGSYTIVASWTTGLSWSLIVGRSVHYICVTFYLLVVNAARRVVQKVFRFADSKTRRWIVTYHSLFASGWFALFIGYNFNASLMNGGKCCWRGGLSVDKLTTRYNSLLSYRVSVKILTAWALDLFTVVCYLLCQK